MLDQSLNHIDNKNTKSGDFLSKICIITLLRMASPKLLNVISCNFKLDLSVNGIERVLGQSKVNFMLP